MHSHEQVTTRIIELLGRHARPGERVGPDTEIVAGLGLDSPQVLELVLELEEAFDVSVSMNALSGVQSVGDLARVIHDLASASR